MKFEIADGTIKFEIIGVAHYQKWLSHHDDKIRRQTIDEFKHFIKWFAEKTHYVIFDTDDFLTEECLHCYPLEDIFAEWEQMKEVRN